MSAPGGSGRRRRRLLALLAGLVLLLVCDQLVLRLALSGGRLGERRIAPFDPPLFVPIQGENFAKLVSHVENGEPSAAHLRFDAELGWGPPLDGRTNPKRTFDWAGARSGPEPLARERASGVKRLVCLGDSFTFAAEVGDHEAWTYVLAAEDDRLEVANLGVGGQGIGQSLLRWRRDGVPLAPDEVWLGWLPSAALRVVTAYRPAHNHEAAAILPKPRFRLDPEGGLELVPNPTPTLALARELLETQERFFEAMNGVDHWVSRVPAAYAPAGRRLVHHTATGRLMLTLLEQGDRDVPPYLLDERSEVYCLTRALVLQARTEAEALGARFRFLVFPSVIDLIDLDRTGRRYWAGLVRELEAEGVAVTDLTGCIQRAGGTARTELWMPGSHLSPLGNRKVAEELRPLLPVD